jgi:hypothetical protein
MSSLESHLARHPHRCLFCNDCVQAHLLGLDARQPDFSDCRAEPITLIITYGRVHMKTQQGRRTLSEGQSCKLEPGQDSHLNSTSADVMIIAQPLPSAA